MKTRNGRPTKKAIRDLCEQHGLVIYALDTYDRWGHVVFGDRTGANAKANFVVYALRDAGFGVTFRMADRRKGLTGCIQVQPLTKE